MSEEKKLLINNTLNVKGAILNAQDMLAVVAYYKLARVQEYVFENAKEDLTADEAKKIAALAIEVMDNSGYTEDDAVNVARERLGYKKAFFA